MGRVNVEENSWDNDGLLFEQFFEEGLHCCPMLQWGFLPNHKISFTHQAVVERRGESL